jgi:hypothetical protein
VIGSGDSPDCSVFLTDDERVLVYDADHYLVHTVDDPNDLRNWLPDDEYIGAMHVLGELAVIDL